MEIIEYIAPDGTKFPSLPSHYGNVHHITKDNFALLGWTSITKVVDDPVQDDSAAKANKAFGEKLKEFAAELSVDLSTLSDEQIGISGLVAVAKAAGVTDARLQKMQNELMLLAFDCMAKSGLNWADTWQCIKAQLTGI